jgi:hypothetical protein
MEGNHKVRRRIDVYVRYEITGHFMPMVHVRKYYDTAEPPLEGGNFADAGELTGHPAFLRENWSPLYFDHNEEEQIREAILKKLSIPSPAGAPHAPSA